MPLGTLLVFKIYIHRNSKCNRLLSTGQLSVFGIGCNYFVSLIPVGDAVNKRRNGGGAKKLRRRRRLSYFLCDTTQAGRSRA